MARSLRRPVLIAILVACVLALAGVGLYRYTTHRQPAATIDAAVLSLDTPETLAFQPRIEEGTLTLETAANADRVMRAFNIRLSLEQKAFLQKNRFVLVPLDGTRLDNTTNFDEMLAAFDAIGGDSMIENRLPENCKLVTPDVALHAFHKFFQMTLEQIEKTDLRFALTRFLSSLLEAATTGRRTAPPSAAHSYDRLRAQIALSLALLDNHGPARPEFFEGPADEKTFDEADSKADTVDNARQLFATLAPELPADVYSAAEKEIANVYEANSLQISPLLGQYDPDTPSDYSQFKPRGYYARSSDLRAFFRAVMFLGRSRYTLRTDTGLADAIILSELFSQRSSDGLPIAMWWQQIVDVTTLYAGPIDDISHTEWRPFLERALGSERPADVVSNTEALARVRQQLGHLRRPRILSNVTFDRAASAQPLSKRLEASLAFTVLGQRFTYDAWMLNRFTEEGKLPGTGMLIPACLGGRLAASCVEQIVQQSPGAAPDAAVRARETITSLARELDALPSEAWNQSMDAAWLNVLKTLTRSYGSGFPLYMQSPAFGAKQVQTLLGSYTELKHDTLLYAKQSYAELGEGGEGQVPPVVKGFVEPNLRFWERLSDLVHRVGVFFESHNLFTTGIVRERLREFGGDVDFYKRLAEAELRGKPISDDDYERLRVKALTYMAQPLSNTVEITEETGKVALVADIHTDGKRGSIVYEGTGRPYLMLALVGNENTPRVASGLVFNHYEFTRSLGSRLGDEEWRTLVYSNKPALPSRNWWYSPLSAK